ncbi:hypothetical protein [Flavobacterium sp.]|uniref:hypothetical protein n=1 Tax=Flavobacterium sp. TaxID=239 RepID=UPI003753934B
MRNQIMNSQSKLILIKTIHTIIWMFFNITLFYMAYEIIWNKIDTFFWLGFGLIMLESIVLLFFKMVCPLTIIARKYSNSKKESFDIYLPNWLAKYNKKIYTTFFILIILGLIYRTLNETK